MGKAAANGFYSWRRQTVLEYGGDLPVCIQRKKSATNKYRPNSIASILLKTWSKTWFYAGFVQDRSNGIWPLCKLDSECVIDP